MALHRVAGLGACAAQGRVREACGYTAQGIARLAVQLIAQQRPHLDATGAQLAQVLADFGGMTILDYDTTEAQAGQFVAAAGPIVGVDFLHFGSRGHGAALLPACVL